MSSFIASSSRVSNHPNHATQDDAGAGVDLLANLDYSSLEELDPSLGTSTLIPDIASMYIAKGSWRFCILQWMAIA
jgi:hypothetical protein